MFHIISKLQEHYLYCYYYDYFSFTGKKISGSEKVSNVPKTTRNERQGQGLASSSLLLQAWHRGKAHTGRMSQHPFESLLEEMGLKGYPGGQEALASFGSQR